jgi:NAD(P)-dependent dehydrogenase (short-subunit alcohol dehydrogenase family)
VEAAHRVADDVRREGREAVVLQLDLEDAAATKAVVDDLVVRFGRIHSVVYAAGPPLEFQYIRDIGPSEWARVIMADVNGCFNLVAATLPHVRTQGGGAYVAVITCALSRLPPRDILSAAPKAAIETLMRGLAIEEGRAGIRVNCAAPGLFAAGLGLSTINENTQGYIDKMTKAIPLQRRGNADELGDVVCFLLSDQARYVSGETIAVAGGLQLV